MPKLYATLIELAQIDKKLAIISAENEDLTKKSQQIDKQVAQERGVVDRLERQFSAVSVALQQDEKKLEDEQHHIMDRRKQMSSLGGAKQAKLLEREIDVAKRSLDDLETRTLTSMEQREKVSSSLEHERATLQTLADTAASQAENLRAVIERNLELEKKLRTQREEVLPNVDPTVLRLYDRIRSKYPAEPLALVADGHCQCCFRALPPQVFNLVAMEHQIQQCPGCHRLLAIAEPTVRE